MEVHDNTLDDKKSSFWAPLRTPTGAGLLAFNIAIFTYIGYLVF